MKTVGKKLIPPALGDAGLRPKSHETEVQLDPVTEGTGSPNNLASKGGGKEKGCFWEQKSKKCFIVAVIKSTHLYFSCVQYALCIHQNTENLHYCHICVLLVFTFG